MRCVPSAVWCLLCACFVVFSVIGSTQRWAKLVLKPTSVTLVWALIYFPVDLARAGTPSLIQELISDTLKTVVILDGFLYHHRGKLSNITVKQG